MLDSLPPLFADKRVRIILGSACLLLAALNGFLYYRDLALAAQSKSDIRELNTRSAVPRTTPSALPLSTSAPIVEPPVSTSTPSPKQSSSPSPKPAAAASSAPAATGKVKITTATEAQLDTLPGIGPSKAKAIVEYRAAHPFTKLEDLKEVNGIGDKTYESLLPYIEL